MAMVAEQRSRLGRQVKGTIKVLEGFTAGHAARLTNHWPKTLRQQSDVRPYAVHFRSVTNHKLSAECRERSLRI